MAGKPVNEQGFTPSFGCFVCACEAKGALESKQKTEMPQVKTAITMGPIMLPGMPMPSTVPLCLSHLPITTGSGLFVAKGM